MRFLILLLLPIFTMAQKPHQMTSGEIHEGLKKLNFLGSALYVAAHPDDENTRLISYLANHVKAHTTYLSLTRGDGGQNLVGTELREQLGLIRTQELLAARRTDGGNQYFTRANDFGFSKHPDETLEIWNKDEVLGDVVWAIRKLQPDIIINRFDHRTPGKTHGHHTSSAMLSHEAFDLSNDPTKYADQLQYQKPWQAQRLFFNTSWWFYGSRDKFKDADKTNLMGVDAGVYYPSLGKSNMEIASLSRTNHKSQGFGSTGSRGTYTEYVEILKGDMPENKESLFEGINTTWTRVKGGDKIGKLVDDLISNYDFKSPEKSIAGLIEVHQAISKLDDGYWKKLKQKEVESLLRSTLGLYTEAVASDYNGTPGDSISIAIEITNRSNVKMEVVSVDIPSNRISKSLNQNLVPNEENKWEIEYKIKDNAAYTNPYWLNETGTMGMYKVNNRQLIGTPESKRAIQVHYHLKVDGYSLILTDDVAHKRNERVDGEVWRPFEIVPEVSVSLQEEVSIFANNESQEFIVEVKAYEANIAGKVKLNAASDWKIQPASVDFSLAQKGETQLLKFTVTPPSNASESQLTAKAMIGAKSYNHFIKEIEYDYIPAQTILFPCESKLVRLDIEKKGENIAYIMGAGDKIPESLERIGYNVDLVTVDQITKDKMAMYDAVVIGIRAYNTEETLKFKTEILLDFVKNGGNMIVQYNTTWGLKADKIGPYPLEISRDRVTDENAEVRFLLPDHEVLNTPNKITSKDFDGWKQERGLYFPNNWDEKYDAVLSLNDKGEDPKDGSLLIAAYGEGYFIYSGISWFRELPVGVAGAYRLFANMLSIGK